MYAAQGMKQGFPDEDKMESDTHTSPSSYESPGHVGGGVGGGNGIGVAIGGEKIGAGAAGLGLAAAAPAYRGVAGAGQGRPGEATRVERQSELPGSPVVSSSGVSPETIHQREEIGGGGAGGGFGGGGGAGGAFGGVGAVEIGGRGGGGGGGLHVVNQTPEPEPSELPGSTYHAYKPYRPPVAGGT